MLTCFPFKDNESNYFSPKKKKWLRSKLAVNSQELNDGKNFHFQNKISKSLSGFSFQYVNKYLSVCHTPSKLSW